MRLRILQKEVSHRLEDPLKVSVLSVIMHSLLLNFPVPIAWWYFSPGKEGQQYWHFEFKVIVVLGSQPPQARRKRDLAI